MSADKVPILSAEGEEGQGPEECRQGHVPAPNMNGGPEDMSDEEVIRFEKMLDDMNLSEENKQPLRQKSFSQKKEMLALQFKRSDQLEGKAKQFIDKLNHRRLKPYKRYDLLASLRVALRANTVSWVEDFGVKGLNCILKNLTYCLDAKSESNSALECVRCLKAFMNNKFGLDHVIKHEKAQTILLAAICLVPPHGPQYYKLIEDCVSKIVLHRTRDDPDFRFKIDVDPLIGKLPKDSVEEGSAAADAELRQYKSKLEEAITAKQEADAKVAILDSKVKQYETEIAELKEKVKQNETEIAELKEKGNSATVSAALIAGLGVGGGILGPPGPPGAGEPKPPLPPPPPGMMGSGGPPPPPPPPPPQPGSGGPMSPPSDELPRGIKPKKKYHPDVQMKRINWNKINERGLNKNSFWVRAAEEKFESKDIFQDLQSQFAAKAPVNKPGKKGKELQVLDGKAGKNLLNKPGKKGKELQVLDGKAGKNLSILLGSLKLPYDEIKRIFVEMDEQVLSLDNVELLIKYMPEAAKMNQLAPLKDEYDSLAEPEQFAVTMSSIKQITPRLKAFEFKMRFPELVQEVKPLIVAATEALEEVKQSQKFAGMLELILLIGNYMNAGSRNAQTVGFEISFITKLIDTKTQDNKSTFMHFLADTVEKKYPDILNFSNELIHIDEAAKVSEENVQSKINAMNASIEQLKSDIKNATEDTSPLPNDRFKEVMDEFAKQAKEQGEVLAGMSKKMSSLYKEVAEYFAFDPKEYTMDKFMGDIKKFKEQFQTARDENGKMAD